MGPGNVKMALAALRSSRWRSLLTMLGIIIGVVSVVTIVSLGEGIKQRIVGQIHKSGPDLITLRSGRPVKHAGQKLSSATVFQAPFGGLLTEADYKTVQAAQGVKLAVPFSYIPGIPKTDTRDYDSSYIIATSEDVTQVLNQKVEHGDFFAAEEVDKNVAVIGKRVAEQLFQENVPIGKLFTIRDQRFAVVGVFEEFDASPLAPGPDYNQAIFIPNSAGKRLTQAPLGMYQILARPQSVKDTDKTITAITESLRSTHAGQEDFTALKQEDNLALAHDVLNMLTAFITSIAAISLLVGGIGILNIMFVSVTERTREIGIRKAVGATNRQILGQFLTEAVILSLSGGVLGIIASFLVNYLLRIFTDLTPAITWPIMVIAVGVAVCVGIVFGITPALKAARKHPIDALRYE